MVALHREKAPFCMMVAEGHALSQAPLGPAQTHSAVSSAQKPAGCAKQEFCPYVFPGPRQACWEAVHGRTVPGIAARQQEAAHLEGREWAASPLGKAALGPSGVTWVRDQGPGQGGPFPRGPSWTPSLSSSTSSLGLPSYFPKRVEEGLPLGDRLSGTRLEHKSQQNPP